MFNQLLTSAANASVPQFTQNETHLFRPQKQNLGRNHLSLPERKNTEQKNQRWKDRQFQLSIGQKLCCQKNETRYEEMGTLHQWHVTAAISLIPRKEGW